MVVFVVEHVPIDQGCLLQWFHRAQNLPTRSFEGVPLDDFLRHPLLVS